MVVISVFCFVCFHILQSESTRIAKVLQTFPDITKVNLFAENLDDLDFDYLLALDFPLRIHENTFNFNGLEKQHLVWIHSLKPYQMNSFVSNTSNSLLINNYWFVSVGNHSIEKYFEGNTKRFSLNMLLFFIQEDGSQIIVKQILGTATTKVQIQVIHLISKYLITEY